MKLIHGSSGAQNGQGHGPRRRAPGRRPTMHMSTPPTATATRRGIEWEDDMVEVNKLTTPANMRWKLVDRSDDAENHAIDWHFRVGDRVKIRLVNEMDSDHPMHHPFHIHGAGRFLILARDGVPEANLVWRTPCWSAPARPWTSSSTSRTRALDGALPHRRDTTRAG